MDVTKKKWGRLLGLAFALVLATLVVAPSAALAEDGYTNWKYEFNFSGTGHEWQTAGRPKVTSTEAFLYIISSSGISGCRFRLDGANSATGPWNKNLTRGGSAYASSNARGYFLISNYVNENGYTYARLTGTSAGGSGTIKGEWSPDTHERYHPLLN